MHQKTYGYMRVSTHEQNEDRQRIALLENGVDSGAMFLDKMSGKNFERPQYKRMLRALRPGDVIFVKSIDRLGRNYADILEQWRVITKEKKADIVVIDMPLLDTRFGRDLIGSFISDMVLQLLSFVAENERANIKARQAEGIAAAKARGVRFGRPPRELPADFCRVAGQWQSGDISAKEAAGRCQMCESTFRKKARAMLALE